MRKLQEITSFNKAISYDGVSDLWLKKTLNWKILSRLWNNDVAEINPQLFKARLIPLNKSHPDIPKETDFRPIVVLSSLYKFMELRFLPNLNKYLSEQMSKEQ